jgi:hypothetical protein
MASLTLAPVTIATSGTPPASGTTWCLDPGPRRSVGLGPVRSPPDRAEMGAVDDRLGPVDLVGAVEVT